MRALLIVLLLLATATAPGAQAPVVNAQVERRTAPQGLAGEIQGVIDRGTPAWIGYRVPILRRANARVEMSDTCCGRCRLEPATDLVVLARTEARAIVDLRAESVDCDVEFFAQILLK